MALESKEKQKIIVDPKGNNFEKYKGSFFITPNAKEAFNATNIEPKNNNLAEQSGKYIIEKKWSQNILLTRGEPTLYAAIKQNIPRLPVVEIKSINPINWRSLSIQGLLRIEKIDKLKSELCNKILIALPPTNAPI